jgi:hypothetical protein
VPGLTPLTVTREIEGLNQPSSALEATVLPALVELWQGGILGFIAVLIGFALAALDAAAMKIPGKLWKRLTRKPEPETAPAPAPRLGE